MYINKRYCKHEYYDFSYLVNGHREKHTFANIMRIISNSFQHHSQKGLLEKVWQKMILGHKTPALLDLVPKTFNFGSFLPEKKKYNYRSPFSLIQTKKGIADCNLHNNNNDSFLSWKRKSHYRYFIPILETVHFTSSSEIFKTIVDRCN